MFLFDGTFRITITKETKSLERSGTISNRIEQQILNVRFEISECLLLALVRNCMCEIHKTQYEFFKQLYLSNLCSSCY